MVPRCDVARTGPAHVAANAGVGWPWSDFDAFRRASQRPDAAVKPSQGSAGSLAPRPCPCASVFCNLRHDARAARAAFDGAGNTYDPAAPRCRVLRVMGTLRGGSWFPVSVVLIGYVILSAGYLWSTPLFEGPDEPSHLEYVGFVAEHGRPPLYGHSPEVPGEGMQPPLYYVAGALFFDRLLGANAGDARDELHRAGLSIYGYETNAILQNRLLRVAGAARDGDARQFVVDDRLSPLVHLRWPSLCFGVFAVVATFMAARLATADTNVGALAAAILAFNPQFLFLSGLVSNDTAATSVGAIAFYITADAFHRRTSSRRHYVLLGLAASAGLAVKLSTVPMVAVAAVFVALIDRRPIAGRLRSSLAAAFVALLSSAPLLAWNVSHRGGPLGTGALWDSTVHLARPEAHGGLWVYFTEMYVPWTLGSYVARFGWMNVDAPWGVYAFALVFALLGLSGFLGSWLAETRVQPPTSGVRLRHYLVAAVVVNVSAHVWLNVHTAQPQGRHLFPASPQIATILALGIRWLMVRGGSLGSALTVCVSLPLLLMGLYCLFGVIRVQYP